jgi:hypothetical protein
MARMVGVESVFATDSNIASDSSASGVSWGAVIAGAFAAAALSLALLALGTGVGFSAVSPWANAGASASAIGWGAIVWLVLMEIIASSIGGYLAGRLRTKWMDVHTHEVYFRDTAHGFLAWAVGLVIMAAFLTSAAASVIGGARTGATAAGASETSQSGSGVSQSGYFADMLLRSTAPSSGQDTTAVRGETEAILANGLRQGSLPAADKSYLAQLVATRTGLSESDAAQRVDDTFSQDQQAADSVRKALAHSMYWTFLALLVGAFFASFSATIGGRRRDRVMPV